MQEEGPNTDGQENAMGLMGVFSDSSAPPPMCGAAVRSSRSPDRTPRCAAGPLQVHKVAQENGVDVSSQMVELENRAREVRHAATPRAWAGLSGMGVAGPT